MVVNREFPPETLAKDILEASNRLSERALPILIIVDRDFNVVLVSQNLEREMLAPDSFVEVEGRRLGPSLDKIVRDLVESWTAPSQRASSRFAAVQPSYIVTATPLYGYAQRFVAIAIESYRQRDSFARAAQTYSLSPRETQVLSLILDGASAAEIASTLSLAASTVQCYFKQLLRKTYSRNRPSMVAKVLGWDRIRIPSPRYRSAASPQPSPLRVPNSHLGLDAGP